MNPSEWKAVFDLPMLPLANTDAALSVLIEQTRDALAQRGQTRSVGDLVDAIFTTAHEHTTDEGSACSSADQALIFALRQAIEQLQARNGALEADLLAQRASSVQRQPQIRQHVCRSPQKSAALAALSHEMLTPLNAILGFSHLLGEHYSDAEPRSYVSGIERAGGQLYALFSQILMYSRLETLERAEMDRPFAPTGIPAKIHDCIGRAASSKGLQIELRHGSTDVLLLGDEQLLVESVAAIATDVVRYTDAGSILIREEHHAVDRDTMRLLLTLSYRPCDSRVINTSSGSGAADVVQNGLGFSIGFEQLNNLGAQVESSEDGHGIHRIAIAIELPRMNDDAVGRPSEQPQTDPETRLTQLLSADDLAARQFFREHRESLSSRLGDAKTRELSRAMDQLDLAGALEILAR